MQPSPDAAGVVHTVQVHVNGAPRAVPEGTTVEALLRLLSVQRERVAVELNGEVIRRARHPDVGLAAGDQVEIVTFVGGG